MPLRVDQVAGQHRVERDPRGRDAHAREQRLGALAVRDPELHRRVFEHGREQRRERLEAHLPRRRVLTHVAERHVGGGVLSQRESQADDRRAPHVVALGGEEQREVTGLLGFVEQRGHRRRVGRERVLDRADRPRRELADQLVELEAGKELAQALVVGAAVGELVEVELDRRVGPERDELLREIRLVLVLDELLLDRLLLERVDVLVDEVEVGVLAEQRRGRLGPDRRNPGHVVGAVADQREVVAQLVRGHAHLLDRLLDAVDPIAHGIEHDNPVADELEQVLVGAHDDHLEPGVAGGLDDRRDDVVGLELGRDEHRDPVGLDHLGQPLDLRPQIVGRRRAGGLVLRVDRLAEGRPARVERHGELGRALRLDEREQHTRDAIDGVRRLARGRAHGRQRVVGAKDVARQVDDVEDVGRARGGKLGGHERLIPPSHSLARLHGQW